MIREPSCYRKKCLHFIGVKNETDEEVNERVVCAVFPDGIPASIAFGKRVCDRFEFNPRWDKFIGGPEDLTPVILPPQ